MATRPMRLGLALPGQGPVSELVEQARRAEQLGFDVVLLIDHLGYTAPLPPLVAIAAAAPTLRVGNLVLNASFYRPALLARDLASVDSATGGVWRSDWAPATWRRSSPPQVCRFRGRRRASNC